MSDKSYKDDVKIDLYKLHFELQRQSGLYMKWAERHADALLERDRVKERLDLMRSELDAEIRRNPTEFSFPENKKPTEAAITATIIKDTEFSKESDTLIEANRNVNIVAGAKEAMNHRKKGLENLVQLWIAGYFSDPSIPKNLEGGSTEEIKQQLKKKLKGRLKGRGRDGTK